MMRALLLGLMCCRLAASEAALLFDVFTSRDGLLHNHVTALYREPDRYLWIGTAEGLCRFDGRQFEDLAHFTNAPEGEVLGLLGDLDGNVWIAGLSTLHVFRDGAFQLIDNDPTFRPRSLFLDKHGDVWVTSNQGLHRYQGTARVNYNEKDGLPSRVPTVLFEDSQERIWVGYRSGGVASFDRAENSWRTFAENDGLPDLTISSFAEDKEGTLWVTTSRGPAVLRRDRFIPVRLRDDLPGFFWQEVMLDGEGALWFSVGRHGVVRDKNGEVASFTPKSGLAGSNVKFMFRDSTDRVWVGTTDGLSVFINNAFQSYTTENGLVGNSVTCIVETAGGVVWIGTKKGLARTEPAAFELLRTKLGPVSSVIRSHGIYVDRGKNLWFPTNEGVGFKGPDDFQLFTEAGGVPLNRIVFWRQDSTGAVWLGGEDGLFSYDGQSIQPVPAFKGQGVYGLAVDQADRLWVWNQDQDLMVWATRSGNEPRLVSKEQSLADIDLQDDGSVWLTTQTQLRKLNPQLNVVEEATREISQNQDRLFDRKGIWWFENEGKLIRLDATSETRFDVPLDKEKEQVKRLLLGPKRHVWLGIGNRLSDLVDRVCRFDGETFTCWGRADGFYDNRIQRVYSGPDNRMWLAGGRGITEIQGGQIVSRGVSAGQVRGDVQNVLLAPDLSRWIACEGGLYLYRDGIFTSFGAEDGLGDEPIVDIALDAESRLWLNTSQSVFRLKPREDKPTLEIAGLYAGDNPLPLRDHPELTNRQNDLVFHLRGFMLSREARHLRFSYVLRRDDDSWSGITTDNYIRFHGLPPGAYAFEAKVYDRYLAPSAETVQYAFTIKPPLILRPWFISLVTAVFALILLIVHRVRTRFKLERARLVNELNTARELQMSLMPSESPKVEGMDVYGACRPALEVGGDYFDYFTPADDHSLGFAVFDVSGKAMGAAIIAVMNSGLVRGSVGADSPDRMLNQINPPLYAKTAKNVFITGIVGIIDPVTRRFRFANAGHMDPILIRHGELVSLDHPKRRDLPLGGMKKWRYQLREWQLESGDLLLLYTDGLSEAKNASDSLYDERRIVDYLKEHADRDAEDLVDGLLVSVDDFAGDVPQFDDITLVVIKID